MLWQTLCIESAGMDSYPMRKVIFPAIPILVFTIWLVSFPNTGRTSPGTTRSPAIQVTSRKVLVENAGRLSWSKSTNIIAYDKLGPNDLYDVWTIRPDGTGDTCLTCSTAALPLLNRGNPVWSADGKFIVFQVQQGPSLGRMGNMLNRPGSGWNNDLWVMDAAGKRFWQLTRAPAAFGGVIHPQFSWAGDKLVWGHRLSRTPRPFGTWQLKLGDFVVSPSGVPSVRNIRTYTPGAQKYYYEPHGFSPDDKTLFFMGDLEPGQSPLGMDIYSLDLTTNKLTNLTNTMDQWDEFPTPTPSGNKLIWSSTAGTASTPRHFRCDLWIMDYDGSNKHKLTFFNDPKSPDYMPDGICAADPDWNADGTQLALYANRGRGPKFPGQMWLLNIKPAAGSPR